jgi:ribonuclease HI
LVKQNILIENSDLLNSNLRSQSDSSPIPVISGCKFEIVASEFKAVPVWTDGSKKLVDGKDVANSACWFSNNSPNNVCFHTVGQQTSFNAELQAIEYAIMSVVDTENIIIFTDSKPAIQIINRYLNKKNCQKTNPTVNRIINWIQTKKEKFNTSVALKQCFSHLLENEKWHSEKLNKLQKQRIEAMKSEYGSLWHLILLGNQQADRLSQLPTINNSTKLSLTAKGLPRFLITDSQTNYTIVESNILQVFKQQSKDQLLQKWIKHCPKRTADMVNPKVNWNKSIWPLLEPYHKENKSIANFQQKLCQRVLPTMKFIFELVQQYEKNGWPKSIPLVRQSKMRLKYSNNLCPTCKITANTKHCFTDCVHVKDQQKKLVDIILLTLNEHRKSSILSFNWWFSTDYKRASFGPSLQGWNLELGDYGCLPMELGEFFQQNGFFDIAALLDKLDRFSQIHCWNLWKIHTKSWEENYQNLLQSQTNQQPTILQFFHPLN